jgi:glycosyltransferase A (GT-A) superfamily protein (DUF2064 family)
VVLCRGVIYDQIVSLPTKLGPASHQSEPCIVLFVRSPIAGQTKTRLAATVGDCFAAQFAAAMVRDILNVLSGIEVQIRCHFDGMPGPLAKILPASIALIAQPDTNLNERLVAACASAEPFLLILGDVPGIRDQDVRQALAHLHGPGSSVIGLVEDGGIWCVGGFAVDFNFLRSVNFAKSDCGTQMRETLRARSSCHQLRTLRDVDTYADASTVAAENPGLHCSQILAAWQRKSAHFRVRP